MLKLILGTAGSGKTSVITNEIRKRVEAGKGGNYLLVPEQYSFEAERELCTVCGDSLSLYAEVLSFSRLAIRVSQETGTGGRVSLDNGGRLLCMSLALSEIGTRLKLYSSAKNKSEFRTSLLQTVQELKAARISPENLNKAALSAEKSLADKLSDLALCLGAYDAILAQGRADPTDRLLRLAETMGQSSVGSGGHIYIDGFTDFTGAEILVLESLLKKHAELTVCLTCDDLYGDSENFEPSRRAANALLHMAKEQGADTKIFYPNPEISKPSTLVFFEEKLFSYTSEVRKNEDNRIRVIRADGIRAECEMAASACLDFVRVSGCRFRDLAVAARGFDSYSAALDEAFRLYGVPLFTARRGSILQKPVPALIASAFEIILGGWDTDDVLNYMKTGLTGIPLEDCDTLENYVSMWHIRGSMWTREKPWTLHPNGFGLEQDEESRGILESIDALRRKIVSPLIALSESGKAARTAAEQAKALSDFLGAIDLPKTLYKKAEELDKADRELLSAEYVQLWDIIIKSLEQTAAILGDIPMTQEEFSQLFLQTLSQYDVSAIPVSADSVTAGDMDRMRRRHIKHLIILGASDDRLPNIQPGSGILSAEERDELNELGISLGGGADELSHELSLIYNCITLPSETLTLSYSTFDDSGAQVRPSFLINRAKMLFNIEEEILGVSKARLSAPAPAFLLASEALRGGDENSRLAFSYFTRKEGGYQRIAEFRKKTEYGRGKLSGEAVTALYGDKLRLSPSRTDAFEACPYSYFLQYGLKLSETETAAFEAPEFGTFMHYVLENTAGEIAGGVGFKSATPEIIEALVNKYTDSYIEEKLGGFEDKSPRFVYLFNRLRPSVQRITADIIRELSKSDFVPLDFELGFMSGKELPPVRLSDGKKELYINGIADRVDGYYKGGKLYIRIIDYKTGKKAFSLSDVWYGMGLQMLIYLFALEREGKARYGADIIPAGVLYIPARDTLISESRDLTDEELRRKRSKNLRRSGLILSDINIIRAMEDSEEPEYIPVSFKKDGSINTDNLADTEQLKALNALVDKRLLELCENITEGNIDASPYYRGEQENACVYCPYVSVCRFDGTRDKRRYLSNLKADEIWTRLEEKE